MSPGVRMDIDKLGDIIIHDLWMKPSSGLGGKFRKDEQAKVVVNVIWSLNGRKEKRACIIQQDEKASDKACKKKDIIPGSLDGVLRCMEDILSVEEGRRPAAFLVGPAGQTVRRLDIWDTPTGSKVRGLFI
ncbi:Hypp7442 [Branchiostoma lanceolatum]|uniref:Hypp7442 protein n=1 Tax=Branchiostoma lanceolatum TaxID=7740 RepID=A0A8K0EBL4_BRALA|nr:Hypp7442 [Branchiostoma lanceolatum]